MSIVILGAGQAGLQIALSLRQKGYDRGLLLVGDEVHLPYQRPPLSKAYLKGQADAASLALRSAEALASLGIELRLGRGARRIDRAGKLVELEGEILPYHKLALALGTRPRSIAVPGADLPGVLSLRGIDDGEALLAALSSAHHVVIIGGGFIGLEVAATAAAAGKKVCVLEAGERVMARAVAPQISTWFERMHRGLGSRVLTSVAVASINGDGHVRSVTLSSGEVLPAEVVLVGVGAIPNDAIASAAGLDCPNGILVDQCGRTSDPDILAAGDCALHPNRFADGLFRLESVHNAIDQAKVVAAAMLGEGVPYDSVPWFWSDQGQAKLQTTGLPLGTELHVTRGDPEAGRFTVFHLKHGRIIAADSVNSPSDHMCARRLIANGTVISPEILANPDTDLKSLAIQPRVEA